MGEGWLEWGYSNISSTNWSIITSKPSKHVHYDLKCNIHKLKVSACVKLYGGGGVLANNIVLGYAPSKYFKTTKYKHRCMLVHVRTHARERTHKITCK